MIAVLCLVAPVSDSFAFIGRFVPIEFVGESVAGQCILEISNDEPYSALNADCELTKNGVRVSFKQISGYDIGWPRPSLLPAFFNWNTIALYPGPHDTYCQKFGDYNGELIFGHHSDPDLNVVVPGVKNCDAIEDPLYRGYFSTGCFDDFQFFWSLTNLIGSGAKFYVVIGEPDCVSVGLPREWEVVW